MSTLTIRIPETKHARLRLLAEAKGISLNRLMDELATVALAEYDAETRFRARAARGRREEGLALLGKLEREARAAEVKRRGSGIPSRAGPAVMRRAGWERSGSRRVDRGRQQSGEAWVSEGHRQP
jgi:hypothetical protein